MATKERGSKWRSNTRTLFKQVVVSLQVNDIRAAVSTWEFDPQRLLLQQKGGELRWWGPRGSRPRRRWRLQRRTRCSIKTAGCDWRSYLEGPASSPSPDPTAPSSAVGVLGLWLDTCQASRSLWLAVGPCDPCSVRPPSPPPACNKNRAWEPEQWRDRRQRLSHWGGEFCSARLFFIISEFLTCGTVL